MYDLIKPKKLREGDSVALITLSSAGAFKSADRYAVGKEQIHSSLGLNCIDAPHAKESDTWIYAHPKERLDDLMWAFKNPDIKAIFSITGGSDCIRLLDYVTSEHLEIIKDNPKIFVGFSDTTVINFLCLKAGIVSFYGPSVLFGMAENGGMDKYTALNIRKTLFENHPTLLLENNSHGWTLDRIPWEGKYSSTKRKLQEPLMMKFIQGEDIVEGHLIGGCMDVIEFMKGTSLWPDKKVWDGAILLIEISEDKPSTSQIKYWLRNYGAQGILKNLKGIIFGIPGGDIDYNDSEYEKKLTTHLNSFPKYDEAIIKICKEYHRENIPIVTQVQFGHTAPMMTLPIGTKARIDFINKKIELIESGVKDE